MCIREIVHEAQTGTALDNSVLAPKAKKKVKAEKAAKKGKKNSLEELQAQIAAKQEAIARMQAGDYSAMPQGAPMDGIVVDAPVTDVPVFTDENLQNMTAEQLDAELSAALGEDAIIFEQVDPNNGSNQ